MRDQGSSASANVLTIDLSHIDEPNALSPEDLNIIVDTIVDPSVQIIDPTFATGKNTRTLISLCEKMIHHAKNGHNDANDELKEVAEAVAEIDRIRGSFAMAAEKGRLDSECASVLHQMTRFESARAKLIYSVGTEMTEFEEATGTMIKLGKALLADQEEYGDAIKTGKPLLRYTFTCRAINCQWVVLQKIFLSMRKSRTSIQQLSEIRKTKRVIFADTNNGNKLVAGLTFAEMAEAIKEIATMDEIESNDQE